MSKVARSLRTRDIYRCYKQYCKEKGIKPKSYEVYKKIITQMGKVMTEMILQDGIIGLPWKNGDIFLKEKPHTAYIDWQQSRIDGKRAYKFNDHSGGKVYVPFWLSPERSEKKLRLWCFSACRNLNRSIGPLIRNGKVYPDFKQMNKRAR